MMSAATSALMRPHRITVNRSTFRERMSEYLRKTRSNTVVVLTTPGADQEKYIVDQEYFEELLRQLKAAVETLEITADPKLYATILRSGETLEKDFRSGKLYSFEEVFGED